MSGTKREGRAELAILLDFTRAGDTIIVTRIDRLARSIGDLQDIVRELKAKGVTLKSTEQPIDTGTAGRQGVPRHAWGICRVRDESARERQLEGIAKAKADGVYAGKGRKASIDAEERWRRLASEGMGASEVAKALKIGRASVYRLLSAAAA